MEIILLFALMLSIGVGVWASSWGQSGIGFGLLSLILSPLLGAIVLLIMGKSDEVKAAEQDRIDRIRGNK